MALKSIPTYFPPTLPFSGSALVKVSKDQEIYKRVYPVRGTNHLWLRWTGLVSKFWVMYTMYPLPYFSSPFHNDAFLKDSRVRRNWHAGNNKQLAVSSWLSYVAANHYHRNEHNKLAVYYWTSGVFWFLTLSFDWREFLNLKNADIVTLIGTSTWLMRFMHVLIVISVNK